MTLTTEAGAALERGRAPQAMSVTAIVPAYNAEAFIGQAIDSILAQTRPADQIIVVDDGSKDGTRAVVEAYGERVQFVQQANQGPSVARNRAARMATSGLLAFLDADDTWEPRKLEKQVHAFALQPDAVLSYTALCMIEPDGSERVQQAVPPGRLPNLLRLGNPGILPSCVMLSRAALVASGGFVTDLRGSEDWDLWLRLQKQGPFCAVDEPLTRYRVSNSGLSGNAEHMLSEAKSMVEDRLLAGLSGAQRWLWRRRILSYQCYKAALTARASGERSGELRYLLQSFAIWPSPGFEPRRWKVLAVTLKNSLGGH